MSTKTLTKHPQDMSTYQGRGYMGLANLGNTCFMNACLQVLNHLYELNHLFLERRLHLQKKPGDQDVQLVKEWVELQEIMRGADSTPQTPPHSASAVAPNKFVHYVHHLAKVKDKDIFTGWAQNDLSEFLLFFLDCLHNSIARGVKMNISGTKKTAKDQTAVLCYEMLKTTYQKEYSEVMDLFYGIYVSEIMAPGAPGSHSTTIYSQKPEQYFIVDLPIPMIQGEKTLVQCFDLFTEGEELRGDNAWYNETTRTKEDAVKRIRFWNFPPVLVVLLKRFTAMGNLKRQDLVTFPLEGLDLSKYVCGYGSEQYVYDLMGVCNHMGGVMGGHYTACVKNADRTWLHFNDTMVETVKDPSSMVCPSAYCLFYRKRTTPTPKPGL